MQNELKYTPMQITLSVQEVEIILRGRVRDIDPVGGRLLYVVAYQDDSGAVIAPNFTKVTISASTSGKY